MCNGQGLAFGRVPEHKTVTSSKVSVFVCILFEITPKEVRFAYRDYRDGNKAKEMTLSRGEFARRFALHILPRRLVKIRHYGYLSNHHRTTRLAKIREKMKIPQPGPKVKVPNSIRMVEKYGRDLFQCPECKTGRMEILQRYHPPSPNPDMKGRLEALEAAESSSKAAPS